MRVEIQTITKDTADIFLMANNSNRKLNKSQLDMLVRAMESGQWALTHQGIAFYEDGSLADGQHRLTAISLTGVACVMPVFYGVEKIKETSLAIDCGRSRTVTDGARISGDNLVNSDVTLAKGFEFGYENKMIKLTHIESANLCEKYAERIAIAKKVIPSNRTGVSIAPVKVALADAVNVGVPIDLAVEFGKVLLTGEYSSSVMANAVRLRNKLLSKNYNGGSDRKVAYNMAYRTLLKTCKGELVKRIVEK